MQSNNLKVVVRGSKENTKNLKIPIKKKKKSNFTSKNVPKYDVILPLEQPKWMILPKWL